MKPATLLLIVTLNLLLLSPACTTRNAASEVPPIKLAVNIWPGYGAFFIARDKGFFRENGVRVEIQLIQGDSEREAAFVAGNIDGIGMTLDNLALLRARGVKAKAIFKYDDSYGADGIVARTSISSLGQLKGKTVAWSSGTPSHYFLTQALKRIGMSTRDLRHVSMAPDDAGAAFAAGKLDAAVTWEPWLSKAQQSKMGHLLISTRELPVVHDVLFLREDSLQKHQKAVTCMLRACFRALDYWKTHPDEGDAITAKGVGLSLDDLRSMLPGIRMMDLSANIAFFGSPDNPGPAFAAFKTAVDAWRAEGVVQGENDPRDAIDTSFLQAIKR